LFLHADTLVPETIVGQINEALRASMFVGGNCHVRFDGESRAAQFLTWLYPQLRRLGLIYGDSGIFVRRDVYEQAGGFRDYPIFEDLDLIRRLKRRGRMVTIKAEVVTSSRRFENRSFAWTFARWMWMQILFWAGVSPHTLGRMYTPLRRREAKPSRDA
jgi:GT2 family glycosyltransferase